MKKKSKAQSNKGFSTQLKRLFQPLYMDPLSFRSYKKKSWQDLFHKTTKPIEEKEFYKKYYGKKVLFISDIKEITSLIHSSKLCRSIALSPTLFSSDYFKALGNMIIIEDTFNLKEKQHERIIQMSKGKIIFILDHKTNSSRGLYGLRGFKALELFLTKKEQLSEFTPGILKEFSRLEKIRIQFHQLYWFRQKTIFMEEEDMKQTFKFLLTMIENSKALKSFQCDLSPFSMEPKFLRRLLLYLDNYNVKSWYVKAQISLEDFFGITQTNSRLKKPHLTEAHDFQQILDTVDLLGLQNSESIDKDLVESCERDDQRGYSPHFLSEIPSILYRHNRVLDINESYVETRKSKNPIDLGSLLQKFGSLRGLYIQVAQGDLMLLENKNQILENLRNVILSEVDYSLYENRKEKASILEPLLEMLSQNSPKLKRMQIYSDSFEMMGERYFGFLIKRNMKIHEKYLEDFERLRELEINTDNGFPNGFEKVVKRLRVLKVNFCGFRNNKGKKHDLQMAPFVGNHLKELHLKIWPKQQEIAWIDKIAWNVDRFPDLEVFVVDDQSGNRIQLEQVCKFMKAVNRLRSLKRLVVEMKLEESRNGDYSNLLSQEVMNTIHRLEDEMIESIQNNTRVLIELHPDLEEIDIQGFCEHKIDGIFYQRTALAKEPEKNLFEVGEKFKYFS